MTRCHLGKQSERTLPKPVTPYSCDGSPVSVWETTEMTKIGIIIMIIKVSIKINPASSFYNLIPQVECIIKNFAHLPFVQINVFSSSLTNVTVI